MRRTVIITGATSGLGRNTAKELAKMDFNLILVGRCKKKGELLIKELKGVNPAINIGYYTTNFSSINETKKTAEAILKNHTLVDVLLNNAGGVFSTFSLTEDGFEQTIATNYLAQFVFTLKLLPILNKRSGRIINVTSSSHYRSTLNFESFTQNKNYFILKAYGQSKLANVMFTYSLARKLGNTNIKINCLNPGQVNTNIGAKSKHWLHQVSWWLYAKTVGITVEKGTKTHVFLASSKEAAHIHGRYYSNMVLRRTSKISYDKQLQEKLWTWSEKSAKIYLKDYLVSPSFLW